MNYIFAIVILAGFFVVIGAALLTKIRHVFLVNEGDAGLLYHKGKFVEVRNAGRHVLWGRHYAIRLQDLRKATLREQSDVTAPWIAPHLEPAPLRRRRPSTVHAAADPPAAEAVASAGRDPPPRAGAARRRSR